MKHLNALKQILLFAALLVTNQYSFSQSYAPDSTFNGTGIKTFTFYNNIDRGYGCALQPDQKMVLAGLSKGSSGFFQLCFTRLNIDGSFDSTFNGTGKSFVGMGSQQSIGGMTPTIKILPDGKIVAVNSGAGGNGLDIMICRLDSNGIPDQTFNTSGSLFVDMLGSGTQPDVANAFDVDANGNIYAVGATRTGGTPLDNDFALIKVTSAGVLDTSFNGDGKMLFNPTNFAEFGRGIKVMSDGKIIFGGTAQGKMMIAKMDSTGVLDTSFNSTGYVSVNLGNSSDMMALDVLPDSRIVVAGAKYTSDNDIALARYYNNGSPDTTFGTNGTASFNPTLTDEIVTSMILMNDGKILLGGYAGNGSFGNDFMVARIDSTGKLDTTFNHKGWLVMNTVSGSVDEEGNGIALMNDGRIIIVGTAIFSSAVNEDVSILRLKEVVVIPSTSVPAYVTPFENIYPNPCYDLLTVNCITNGRYGISDLTGRILAVFDLKTGKNKIPMKGIDQGIYFLRNFNTGFSLRFVKI